MEGQIGRRILQQHRAFEGVLHLVDMLADAVQRRRVVGQWQQVIEKHRAVARPGQMFGKGLRLIALESARPGVEVLFIQRPFGTDGQADTVQRQRILLADQTEKMMKRTAGHHVVFGVDFEETDVR